MGTYNVSDRRLPSSVRDIVEPAAYVINCELYVGLWMIVSVEQYVTWHYCSLFRSQSEAVCIYYFTEVEYSHAFHKETILPAKFYKFPY